MRPLLPKLGWMLAGVLALFTVSTLAGVVSGGPLDPPSAPGSTMLRLSELPPSWHQILPSNDTGNPCNSARFQCVMSDTAVLDKETGLVWERTVAAVGVQFGTARATCEGFELGGRYGWRLPTEADIRTLADTSADRLPDGHPFVSVLTAGSDTFWTGNVRLNTTHTDGTVRVVNIDSPGLLGEAATNEVHRRWCVRGGAGFYNERF